MRTDRHNHRPIAGDTELADAIKLLARAHQSFIWDRQRQINRLRNALREFYPQARVMPWRCFESRRHRSSAKDCRAPRSSAR